MYIYLACCCWTTKVQALQVMHRKVAAVEKVLYVLLLINFENFPTYIYIYIITLPICLPVRNFLDFLVIRVYLPFTAMIRWSCLDCYTQKSSLVLKESSDSPNWWVYWDWTSSNTCKISYYIYYILASNIVSAFNKVLIKAPG